MLGPRRVPGRFVTQRALSVGLVDHQDTTAALAEGRVAPRGIGCEVTTTSPADLFRRQAQSGEFDVAEMSISTHIAMTARSDDRFVGLPVFPRRAFRHGFIFVNTRSGITAPAQLEGRRVGVSEYQQTASLWIRGILRDEYGVRTDLIEWLEGGMHEPAQPERYSLELPERVRIRRIGDRQTLDAMLVAGEIDALIGAQRPRSFIAGTPHVQRLIPDHRSVERAYYRKTGFYPPMHMVVVRRGVYERDHSIAVDLCDAFEASKRDADERLRLLAQRSGSVPWLQSDLEEIEQIFGSSDFRPYGLARNRATMEKIAEMSFVDGLSPERIGVDGLFAETVRDWRLGP